MLVGCLNFVLLLYTPSTAQIEDEKITSGDSDMIGTDLMVYLPSLYVQTGSEAQSASNPVGIGPPLPRGKAGQGLMLT
jgi:hypothetical protein